MPDFGPVVLIELVEGEPAGGKIEGEAVMRISRGERGGMAASGTFRTVHERLGGVEGLIGRLFQHEGAAYEGDKGHEVRAAVYVVSVQGNLYELETSTEAVIVEKL